LLDLQLPTDLEDREGDAFLAWALERLNFRRAGFRKVRKQVHKRIKKHLSELGLGNVAAYRSYLEAHPEEWDVLDALCRITISRFWRGKGVFHRLETDVLPSLVSRLRESRRHVLRCWSAGCASGEEPYSLRMLWELELRSRFPDIELGITATDSDQVLLERAETAVYDGSSLRDVPVKWVERAFERRENQFALRASFKEGIEFKRHDIRREAPVDSFDLILCRNLAFTYFEERLQTEVLGTIADRLTPGGVLLIGEHETLPDDQSGLTSFPGASGFYGKE
jgi:chemotaxis protein methyltransferase CheR